MYGLFAESVARNSPVQIKFLHGLVGSLDTLFGITNMAFTININLK